MKGVASDEELIALLRDRRPDDEGGGVIEVGDADVDVGFSLLYDRASLDRALELDSCSLTCIIGCPSTLYAAS